MSRKLKNVENETKTLKDLNYGKKTDKQGKWETHMLGPGMWWERLKKGQKWDIHTKSWNIARNSEKREKW